MYLYKICTFMIVYVVFLIYFTLGDVEGEVAQLPYCENSKKLM